MKTFENKPTEMSRTDGDKKVQLGFLDLVKVGLDNPPIDGWVPSEMRYRSKLIKKISDIELNESVDLEDAEFEKIYNLCSERGGKLKWKASHADIVAFDDYLEELNKEE